MMKLKHKLPLLLSIFLFSISILLSIFYFFHQKKFYKKLLQKEEQVLIDNYKNNIKNKANTAYQTIKTLLPKQDALLLVDKNSIDLDLDLVKALVKYESEYSILICELNEPYKIVLHSENPKLEGTAELLLLPETKENIYEQYKEIIFKFGEAFYEYKLYNKENKLHSYISYLKLLPEKDWIIGVYISTENLELQIAEQRSYIGKQLWKSSALFLASGIIISLILSYIMFFAIKLHSDSLHKLSQNLITVASGGKAESIDYSDNNEIGEIKDSIDLLISNLDRYTNYAQEIGKGNLDEENFKFSPNDILGNSLNSLRMSLLKAKEQEEERKNEIAIRNWANEGYALFSDILRSDHDNTDLLAYDAISNMVQYVRAHQGAIFIYHQDKRILSLAAAYAAERNKFMQKDIKLREGLVGACAAEMNTLHYKKIPADYLLVTSGLGKTVPQELLLVPLILDNMLFGVIEIANLQAFKPEEIEFVERVSNSIASTLNSVRIAEQTKQFLENAKLESELRLAQEEELRQNIEELRAIREQHIREERGNEKKPLRKIENFSDHEEGIELF